MHKSNFNPAGVRWQRLRGLAACVLLLLFSGVVSVQANTPYTPLSAATLLAEAGRRGLPSEGTLLAVSVAEQRLLLLRRGSSPRSYVVSTSKVGVGSRENSLRTPLGWHRVTEWIGADQRPGQIFVARRPTSEILDPAAWRSDGPGDWVTTRILRLDGLEPGLNHGPGIDSRQRHIYLHGTNQEHLLGQPASQGCVRLSNRDIMELFDLTHNQPTYCWITEQPLAHLHE